MLNNFSEKINVNDEITLARNSDNEFYRILRTSQNYSNANIKTFGDKKTYDGKVLTSSNEVIESIEYYRNNTEERLKYKNDQDGTNICDNPSMGSVRMTPPYEDPEFDEQYGIFINSLIEDNNTVVDYGGGTGLFLGCLDNINCKKILAEKNGMYDVEKYNIKYVDADEFDFTKMYDYFYCYHCIEHLSNPEEIIEKIINSTSKICFFATPLEELLETSVHHYIFIQMNIILDIMKKLKVACFVHISKHHPIDVHFMIVKDKEIFNKINKDNFFRSNFKFGENYRNYSNNK